MDWNDLYDKKRKVIITIISIVIVLVLFLLFKFDIAHSETLTEVNHNTHVRMEPSTRSEIISDVNDGDKILVLSEENGWSETSEGYVFSKFLDDICELTYLGNWHMTAYTHTGNPCANGNYPTDGYTIACNSLDFGTEVYIPGIGFRTVEDRGPGSLGSEWCDIFMDSYDACVQWGSQYKDIYLVGPAARAKRGSL